MNIHESLGRREVLRRIGLAGVAVPVVGLLGTACDDKGDEAAAAEVVTGGEGGSQTVANSAGTAGAAATAAPQQAVDLDYLPNPEVAPPIDRNEPGTVQARLEIAEVEAKLADGVGYKYWTFNGTVPGPMIRARVGDHVEITIANPKDSGVGHNVDFHAATGQGGGAELSRVNPGEEKSFRFKVLVPGVYIYHCATAPIDLHISNGMYGLIVVEPEGGLPPVDREFYVCQGDIYTTGATGEPGMQSFDLQRLSDERPSYVVFNGAVGSVTGDRALRANVGETVRIFFGVGGPNLTSSFHVIGEIFDRVTTWGSFSSFSEGVQTVSVPPGAATMVEFALQVPATYLLVDHALSRLTKGAAGHLVVEGPEDPDIFTAI
ncbi:MAG: nitrite reductase, copper-containing [Dehalococcoidia bacterium]|nr:nitrite reductase, copper-containing [Dehalococcoidia bacterium]MCA9851677.1 nitrite reductase, copper-containing [Dehalococcoidia bacterium]MCB9491628.1 nitrite reductase, copper-containing [Dehalococcoidia bacterium]